MKSNLNPQLSKGNHFITVGSDSETINQNGNSEVNAQTLSLAEQAGETVVDFTAPSLPCDWPDCFSQQGFHGYHTHVHAPTN